MKIQCDVCNKKEACVYCIADEAALCEDCDHRVHHVNKLAGKHQRFSLLHPSPKQAPLCDICQERRGFLFCQQDRAILCRECDVPIHKANEHTQKHNRFLLTGIKLSPNSSLYSPTPSPSAASSANSSVLPSFKSQSPTTDSVSSTIITSTKAATVEAAKDHKVSGCNGNVQLVNVVGNSSTSSISEYLEMLPGFHVEDFLDSSTPNGFPKIGDEDILSFWDNDLESHMSCFPTKSMGIWVPQAPPIQQSNQAQVFTTTSILNFGEQIGLKDSREVMTSIKSSRKWRDHDNSFAVPQISPPSTSFKKSRTLW